MNMENINDKGNFSVASLTNLGEHWPHVKHATLMSVPDQNNNSLDVSSNARPGGRVQVS